MRYKVWDKKEDIFTLGKDDKAGKMRWTAREYIDTHALWADLPDTKVIIGGGKINGTVFMEFDATVKFYKNMGAAIVDGMTDRQILDAIEDFEDNPPVAGIPSAEERIAAALEFNNILRM